MQLDVIVESNFRWPYRENLPKKSTKKNRKQQVAQASVPSNRLIKVDHAKGVRVGNNNINCRGAKCICSRVDPETLDCAVDWWYERQGRFVSRMPGRQLRLNILVEAVGIALPVLSTRERSST